MDLRLEVTKLRDIVRSNSEKRKFYNFVLGEFDRIDKCDACNEAYERIIMSLHKEAKEMNNITEMQYLAAFLPREVQPGDIEDFIVELNLTDMGAIMKAIKEKFGNTANMRTASNLVKGYLKTLK